MTDHIPVVYIVDDDASVCRALALLLQAHDFDVKTFPSAEDFLAFKHIKGDSCLILDLRLPHMNGLALQEKMASQGVNIPIIFISGQGDIPNSVKAMKEGAVDFLPKPFSKKDLLAAIARAIEKSRLQNIEQTEVEIIRERMDTLSPRELEVFRMVAEGMLSKQIAFERGTALQTIKVHRSRVMQKMQAKSVTELIRFAEKVGLVPSEQEKRRDSLE